MKNKIKIEIQFFRGCPNSEEMILRVKKAIRGKEYLVDYKEVLVENNELAEKLNFLGSPTALINGKDFESREVLEAPSLNCRVYQGGLPSTKELKMKIFKEITENYLTS